MLMLRLAAPERAKFCAIAYNKNEQKTLQSQRPTYSGDIVIRKKCSLQNDSMIAVARRLPETRATYSDADMGRFQANASGEECAGAGANVDLTKWSPNFAREVSTKVKEATVVVDSCTYSCDGNDYNCNSKRLEIVM
eukprot:454966-Amphidinium_carterae.1